MILRKKRECQGQEKSFFHFDSGRSLGNSKVREGSRQEDNQSLILENDQTVDAKRLSERKIVSLSLFRSNHLEGHHQV